MTHTGRSVAGALRVLIVDDERDTVLTLSTLLRDEGYDVRGLHQGSRAARTASEFEPDAVILDIALQDASGFDVARQIRGIFGEEKPLLIAISGRFKQGSDRILGQIAGFNHYLTKPYDPQALLQILHRLSDPSFEH